MKDYRIADFFGGINESVEESLLNFNEAKAAQNCSIDKGILESCQGYSVFATCPTIPETIMTYYKNQIGYIIVAGGGKLYEFTDGWIEIGSGYTSNKWDYINYNYNGNDVIIMTNGTDYPQIFDGHITRPLKNRRKVYNSSGVVTGYIDANGVARATESAVTTYAPKGSYIDLHYERVWIADDNNLYFSTANSYGFDPEDFTVPTDKIEANQHGGMISAYTNDGTKIIGLKVLFDDIVYFKNKSMFKIFGSYPGNYTKIQLFSSNGAIADKSIVATNQGAFFINRDGIYIYDGSNVRLISQKIEETFNKLKFNYLQHACAFYWKNKYILSVPELTTDNDLIIEFDTERKSFMFKRGIKSKGFEEFEGDLYFIDDKVYKYNSGTSFSGGLINVVYETGVSDLGLPDATKEVDSIYYWAKGNGQIKVTCITEEGSFIDVRQLTSDFKLYNPPLSNSGKCLGFKFENINGSWFKFKGFKAIVEYDLD